MVRFQSSGVRAAKSFTVAQELGFTIPMDAYVESKIKAGLMWALPRLSFFFNAHNDFLKSSARAPNNSSRARSFPSEEP